MTRRTLISGIAAVGIAGFLLSGKSDDVLRALGAKPAAEVLDDDQELVKTAIAEGSVLWSAAVTLNATLAAEVLQGQINGLGGTPTEQEFEAMDTREQLATACHEHSLRRSADAVAAVSTQLAQTLAAMAGGLAQLAATPSEQL